MFLYLDAPLVCELMGREGTTDETAVSRQGPDASRSIG